MIICLEALVKDKEILTNFYQNIDDSDLMKSNFKKLNWETISALLKFGQRLKSGIHQVKRYRDKRYRAKQRYRVFSG